MIDRLIATKVASGLRYNPAVALLGPRQVGKTTLARAVAATHHSIYLDLESPADEAKLQDPFAYLSMHKDKLVVLDEIQRQPELFKVLRVLIDQARQSGNGNGRYLILGSASTDLLQQSSESLAGRIHYLEMAGINALESPNAQKLWLRGGFPSSLLAPDETISTQWRTDFIKTYLERDIPSFGYRIPATLLRRLWTVLAHAQGGSFNASALAAGMDVTSVTLARYVDILCDLLLLRKLPPHYSNSRKRLVKAPKVYVRDSGLVHSLLSIFDLEGLLSHPVCGPSWEGFVVENLLGLVPQGTNSSYFRTATGNEIDLVLELPDGKKWAIEIKRTSSPKVEKGFYLSCEDLQPHEKFVVYNGTETYPLPGSVMAIGLPALMDRLRDWRS